MARRVMTVKGPIGPQDLGLTLIHEHLYMAFAGFGPQSATSRPLDLSSAAEARWDPLAFPDAGDFTDIDLIVDEVQPFVSAGGQTIVDVTPNVLSRNPTALREIADRAGINVVMGVSYFTEPFHPPELAGRTDDDLAEEFIREIRHGVGDTGIRPGVMGEIGVGNPFTKAEARLLRIHARVQHETDLPLIVHLQALGTDAAAVLDLLVGEGVSPDRMVLGHMTPMIRDDRYQRSLLDRGAFLAYDYLGLDYAVYMAGQFLPNDYDVAVKLAELVREGYVDQILLSHDIGSLLRLTKYGSWGFAHIPKHFVPLLHALGVTPQQTHTMLYANPARLLAAGAAGE